MAKHPLMPKNNWRKRCIELEEQNLTSARAIERAGAALQLETNARWAAEKKLSDTKSELERTSLNLSNESFHKFELLKSIDLMSRDLMRLIAVVESHGIKMPTLERNIPEDGKAIRS